MKKAHPAAMLLAFFLFAILAGCGDQNDGCTTEPTGCSRRILETDVTNARDLGDLPLTDCGYVTCRKLLRGGDLTGLSTASCEEFGQLGIATVIDLRAEPANRTMPA
jgi:hypothetical protein